MKVQHPDFPSLVREVSNSKSWLAAGWLEVVESVPVAKPRKRTVKKRP